jgi:hypothetical protein
MRSLSSRLLLAMTGVAVLGAVLAGVLTAPLLSGASREAVRAPLAQQAELLSRLPPLVLRSERLDLLTAETEVGLGLVGTDGSTSGVASALGARDLEALADGRPVSTRVRYDGDLLLVEAHVAQRVTADAERGSAPLDALARGRHPADRDRVCRGHVAILGTWEMRRPYRKPARPAGGSATDCRPISRAALRLR